MRLYIDLDTLRLRAGLLNPEQLPGGRIELKRGDTLDLDVVFVRDSVAVEVDAGGPEATGQFMLKRVGEFDGDPLVSALAWQKIGSGQSAFYRFSPSLNTVELNAELGHDGSSGNDVAFADLIGEVEWIIGSAITSTIPFSVRVWNDVIKGSEGVPLGATPAYPVPGQILVFRPDIAALTGGAPDALDSITTDDVDMDIEPTLVAAVIGGALKIYRLQAGTDGEAAPGIIRPDDFATGTNEKIWKQVL